MGIAIRYLSLVAPDSVWMILDGGFFQMIACGNRRILLWFACSGLILASGCANQTANPVKENSTFGLAAADSVNSKEALTADSNDQRRGQSNARASLSTVGDTNQPDRLPKRNLWLESAKVDFARLPARFLEESRHTFWHRGNMTALLLAGGASIAMHNSDADDNIAENFARNRVFHDFTDESLNIIGGPPTHFAATGFWYVLSAENQDEFNKERAWTMMTALSVNAIVTVGLKAIRNNETPNGGMWAWPSGHTSSSFTVASVLDEFYGPKVGIPAYGLAALVAWRMMDAGDHWGSDVLFGATLGWVVGHSVAGRHKQLELAGFDVLPYVANSNGSAAGISLMKRF